MSAPTTLSTSALQEAFATFNQLSSQLADSYHALETRVSDLNDELARSHDARLRELTEKERLAQRLSTLLQALPGGVVVLDGSGCVQEYNHAAADLLGEPLNGISWLKIIARSFAPRLDDGHEVSLVDGRRVTIATCPMVNEPGQILLLTEVTEMRRLQDQLAQQQRLAVMGEMAASLAHQIRTPLASAMLYTSQLKHPGLESMERDRFTEKIRSRLAHLERLVTDMLMYARSGHPQSAQLETFQCGEMLVDLEHSVDAQVLQSKTHYSWIDHTNAAVLHGNRQMLVSALSNLVVNAIQAMGTGGRVAITAEINESASLVIRVCDNGPGIPADKITNIFDPFFTTRNDGTGLGLAVVNAVVHAHAGEIAVESSSINGTVFLLRLPIIQDVQMDHVEKANTNHARISRAG